MLLKYDENDKYQRFARNATIVVISLAIFTIIWWVISIIADTKVLPTPIETVNALFKFFEEGYLGTDAWSYIFSSLVLFLKGFLLAFVLAVPIGLVLGFSKTLHTLVSPMIEVLRPIAPMAWAPIFIYGVSYQTGPILVVFIGIFFPLLTNVIFGVKKIDPVLVDAAKTLGASRLQIFTKVMLPSSVPFVMNGVKVGLGVGWMCIVAAEMYSPLGVGVGYCISNMCTSGLWASTFAMLIVVAILGILTITVSEYLQKYLSKRMGIER